MQIKIWNITWVLETIGGKPWIYDHQLYLSTVLVVLIRWQAERETKCVTTGKEEIKRIIHTDNMILYIENLKKKKKKEIPSWLSD